MGLLDPTQLITGLLLMGIGSFFSAIGTAVWHLYRKVKNAFRDIDACFTKLRELERKLVRDDNDDDWGDEK